MERFAIEKSWPMFTLVTREADSSREHSLAVLRVKSEATKLKDVKLLPNVLSALTVDNPLTMPEISEKLKLPKPDVCRVLHTAMREGKVKKTEDGRCHYGSLQHCLLLRSMDDKHNLNQHKLQPVVINLPHHYPKTVCLQLLKQTCHQHLRTDLHSIHLPCRLK